MSTNITVLDRDYTKHGSKTSMDFQPMKDNEAVVVFTAEHGFVILDKKFQTATPVDHLSIFGIPADKALRYEFGYACGQCNCRIVDVATGAAWDRYADSMDVVLKRVLDERAKSVAVQARREEAARKWDDAQKRQGDFAKPVIVEGNNPERVAETLLKAPEKTVLNKGMIEQKVSDFKFAGPDGKTYTCITITTVYED